MQEWEQWISINKPKLIHVANFEERFVREILARIPEITPNDVIAQYHFQFPNGSNGYIDFCIKNDSKGYFVSIELDGAWKASAQDFAALLERQNVLMASHIGTLLRFANSTWLGKSGQTIQSIRKVLAEQHKAFNDKVSSEDLMLQLKTMQDELLRLKQQNSNNETTQLTTLVGNLSKQLHEQKVGSNNQDINTVMLGLAQQIKDLSQVPPVQSKQYVPLYIGIGLAFLIGLSFVMYSLASKPVSSVNRTPDIVESPPRVPDTLGAAIEDTEPRLSVPNTIEAALENVAYLTDSMEEGIPSSSAKNHVGDTRIVCGYVAQIKEVQGRTYINMGNVYPNQEMTIVIWPDDADKVSRALTYDGKIICIEGKITIYKDIPQITLKDPKQMYQNYSEP